MENRTWRVDNRTWWLLGAPGGSWGLLGGRKSYLVAPGGSWWLLVAPGGSWGLLGAPGGSWEVENRTRWLLGAQKWSDVVKYGKFAPLVPPMCPSFAPPWPPMCTYFAQCVCDLCVESLPRSFRVRPRYCCFVAPAGFPPGGGGPFWRCTVEWVPIALRSHFGSSKERLPILAKHLG